MIDSIRTDYTDDDGGNTSFTERINYVDSNYYKSVTQDDGTVDQTITYDASHRLIKLEFGTAAKNVTTWKYDASGFISEEETQGYVQNIETGAQKFVFHYTNGLTSTIDEYEKYGPNATYEYYGFYTHTWENGNLVKVTLTVNGSITSTKTFTYDQTKKNSFLKFPSVAFARLGDLAVSENLDAAYFISKNILTRATQTGDDPRDYKITTSFNSDSLITKKEWFNVTENYTDQVDNFFYHCK